jgi:hypothetical protein
LNVDAATTDNEQVGMATDQGVRLKVYLRFVLSNPALVSAVTGRTSKKNCFQKPTSTARG